MQSNLTRLYPSRKPNDAEKGGYNGVFDSDLTLYCGIGFDLNEDNDCIIRCKGGLFLWSERTMVKLEHSKVTGTLQFKQMKLVCSMIQLMYSLMIAHYDVIREGVPFQQFVGPIKLGSA